MDTPYGRASGARPHTRARACVGVRYLSAPRSHPAPVLLHVREVVGIITKGG